jgi:two-component system alkaline phosphatase synthesis response regulator PhoP
LASSTFKLLVAEDEATVLAFMAWWLRPFRFELATALNGEEAVEKARTFRPDGALLNYMMPRMNGLQAAVEIRKILPDCKFAFFTGNYGNPKFHEQYSKFGFSEEHLIEKPFKVVDMLRLLARAGMPLRPIHSPDKLQEWMAEFGTPD